LASTLFLAAGLLCIVTAVVHSLIGEARLIGPLLRGRQGVMARPLSRQVVRFAWHWTSALWLLVAAVLLAAALGQPVERWLLACIGAAHVVMGLFDAVITRGKHIGWPLITLIGGLTLLALLQTR
jgi:hypothetical protein